MAETQTNGGLPPQFLRQLRQIREEFSRDTLPQIKAKRSFVSNGEKRREGWGKTRWRSCQKPAIRFSPFAMTLGNDLPDVRRPISKSPAVGGAAIPAQTGQLVSVFIVAMVKTNPLVYVMQKVQRKSAPGFPGGGIKNGETILQTGAREFREESNGGDLARGVDITLYNPLCIGKFVLDRAVNGEQGAVVLVEIPESEIANLKAGGAEEGEIIEKVFFMTFDEVAEKAESRTILPNSVRIWDLYCNYLVNAL